MRKKDALAKTFSSKYSLQKATADHQQWAICFIWHFIYHILITCTIYMSIQAQHSQIPLPCKCDSFMFMFAVEIWLNLILIHEMNHMKITTLNTFLSLQKYLQRYTFSIRINLMTTTEVGWRACESQVCVMDELMNYMDSVKSSRFNKEKSHDYIAAMR